LHWSFFPTSSTHFDAAKGGADGEGLIGVDPDRALLQGFADAPNGFVVLRPNASGQTLVVVVVIVVALGNWFVLVCLGQEGEHWPKNVLSAHPIWLGRWGWCNSMGNCQPKT
jgi:hypothetical protein